jgi:hypothetical protein
MIAEMTNLPTTDIWEHMDIVAGLQYVALWHESKGAPLQARRNDRLSIL